MNKIVSKEYFSANVVKLEVEAPMIARSRKAGHFVIVKLGEKGERIPLTIAGADTEKGTITVDGINIKDLTEKSLRENIAIIRQEPFIFNRTIKGLPIDFNSVITLFSASI